MSDLPLKVEELVKDVFASTSESKWANEDPGTYLISLLETIKKRMGEQYHGTLSSALESAARVKAREALKRAHEANIREGRIFP